MSRRCYWLEQELLCRRWQRGMACRSTISTRSVVLLRLVQLSWSSNADTFSVSSQRRSVPCKFSKDLYLLFSLYTGVLVRLRDWKGDSVPHTIGSSIKMLDNTCYCQIMIIYDGTRVLRCRATKLSRLFHHFAYVLL